MTNIQKSSADEFTTNLTNTKEGLAVIRDLLRQLSQTTSGPPEVTIGQLQNKYQRLRMYIDRIDKSGQRMAHQNHQLNQLIHTTALITSTLDLDKVLEEVMDTVVQLAGAERAYLMLYNAKKELIVKVARNWDQKTLDASQIGLSNSVVQTAIQQGQAIITFDAQDDNRFARQKSIVAHGLRSIICIPLTLGGQTVGVLYADNRHQIDVFSQDNIPILTAFGTQAAIAINNAREFEQVSDNLKAAKRQIAKLKIAIDRQQIDSQVEQITDTDYFQHLAQVARKLRFNPEDPAPE